MLKFIHLTDTHVIGGARLLYGADPTARLRTAVDSMNADHSDAAFVIHTGDMTHWGDAAAYEAFAAEISRLSMPIHLMVGNHDATEAFRAQFPAQPLDPNCFAQQVINTEVGRFILLDTRAEGRHSGQFCADRRAWLAETLEGSEAAFLFMHHPPFAIGIQSMDDIMLEDVEAFYELIAPHKHRLKHLFFGHLHRAVFGNWRGISWSCMRGLNHQVALDLAGADANIAGDLASPAYGVVLASNDQIIVHLHEFMDTSPRFSLKDPVGVDHEQHALNMRHEKA